MSIQAFPLPFQPHVVPAACEFPGFCFLFLLFSVCLQHTVLFSTVATISPIAHSSTLRPRHPPREELGPHLLTLGSPLTASPREKRGSSTHFRAQGIKGKVASASPRGTLGFWKPGLTCEKSGSLETTIPCRNPDHIVKPCSRLWWPSPS